MSRTLPDKIEAALTAFMQEFDIADRDKAIAYIVKDWLVERRYGEQSGQAGKTPPDAALPLRETVQYPSYLKGQGSI